MGAAHSLAGPLSPYVSVPHGALVATILLSLLSEFPLESEPLQLVSLSRAAGASDWANLYRKLQSILATTILAQIPMAQRLNCDIDIGRLAFEAARDSRICNHPRIITTEIIEKVYYHVLSLLQTGSINNAANMRSSKYV